MAVIETFSKRMKKQQNAGMPDVYQYDQISKEFRNQVLHIWRDSLGVAVNRSGGGYVPTKSYSIWDFIEKQLARELGKMNLGNPKLDPYEQCCEHLIKMDTLEVIDIIELSFRLLQTNVSKFDIVDRKKSCIIQSTENAIQELNLRFQEHGIGYQFINGEIIRVDSQFIHANVVKPALNLLQTAGFGGAEQEFLRAHEHHRKGNEKEAVTEALKAFESTMKSICDAHSWIYASGATASQLLTVLFDNGLVPTYLQSQFTSLKAVLESGTATVRNKTSAHGQGNTPVVIPSYLAAYALHTSAANIVLLVEAHQALLSQSGQSN